MSTASAAVVDREADEISFPTAGQRSARQHHNALRPRETRPDGLDRDLDRMLAWEGRADGALVLARWALGASPGQCGWS